MGLMNYLFGNGPEITSKSVDVSPTYIDQQPDHMQRMIDIRTKIIQNKPNNPTSTNSVMHSQLYTRTVEHPQYGQCTITYTDYDETQTNNADRIKFEGDINGDGSIDTYIITLQSQQGFSIQKGHQSDDQNVLHFTKVNSDEIALILEYLEQIG